MSCATEGFSAMISDFAHVVSSLFSGGRHREIGIPTIRASRAHVHARAPMNSMYPKKAIPGRRPAQTPPTVTAPPRGRRIQVRRSGVHGKGVFALPPIAEGERIIEYTGKVITWKQAQKLPSARPRRTRTTRSSSTSTTARHRRQRRRQRREVDQPRLRPELRSRRDRRRPRLHQGAARHRARRGAELRLRPDPRRPPHQEGEEGIRVPLRQPQVPRYDAGCRRK